MDSTQQTSEVKGTHLVWEDNEDESLCGLDVSGFVWEKPIKPWGVTAPWDCSLCVQIDSFLKMFEIYNTTYDVRTSIEASIQSIIKYKWDKVAA